MLTDFSWLPGAVSKYNQPSRKVPIVLNDEEKTRLVAYMNVLIGMERSIDQDATNET